MKKKKWHTSPWAVSIGTALFAPIPFIIYDAIKQKPILTTLSLIGKSLWKLLSGIMNFQIKAWWLLVAIALIFGTRHFLRNLFPAESIKPDFYDYREGRPKKWRWTWEWKFNQSKRLWIISHLTAHCPKCDSSMIDNSSRYGPSFSCPLCDFTAMSDYDCDEPHKIGQIILDNIERMRQGKKKIG